MYLHARLVQRGVCVSDALH